VTYDQWKTTDPREYERDPEDEPSELDLSYDRIRELEADIKASAETSAARIKELEASLLECLEWFKKQYDIVDGLNGPEPNSEMRLGTMIEETLYGIRF